MTASAETKPKSSEPGYNAWKVGEYRRREKAKQHAAIVASASRAGTSRATKTAYLAKLILEAQALAAEINAETIAELRKQPMSMAVAKELITYDDKEMRIIFAKVDLTR